MNNNPFAGLFGQSKNSASNNFINTSDDNVNIIENVFGFTLNAERASSNSFVYMENLFGAFGSEVNLENLEYVLFERLLLQNLSDKTANQNIKITRGFHESKVVIYLFYSFKNAMYLKTSPVKESVLKLILRNLLTCFKQPDLYPHQDVYGQLFELLCDSEHDAEDFFNAIYKSVLTDDDSLKNVKDVYEPLFRQFHIATAQMTLVTLKFGIIEWLKFMTNFPHLCSVLIDYCEVKKGVGMEYSNTLLGALFSISILPKTHNGKFDYFENPLDQASNAAQENVLFGNLEKLNRSIYEIILNLLKSDANTKNKTLNWLGNCLTLNRDRGKVWNVEIPDISLFNTVSDGFMINFATLLLHLSQPFCSIDNYQKILKVDPTYCSSENSDCEARGIHISHMSEETCLLPVEEIENNREPRLVSENYSFMTEIYYMCHKALELGHKVVIDKLVKLNQDIGRLERTYNDILNQAGSNHELVDSIKERMTQGMIRYLSIKASLLKPCSLERIFNFVTASCFWFTQVAVNESFSKDSKTFAPLNQKPIVFPLKDSVPATLKCIPEFLIENIISYLVFLKRFQPKLYEMEGYEHMKPILPFILIYMGSAERVKNPHLRAHLAEALEALLPFHKDEEPLINTMGSVQREKLFKDDEYKHEIVRSLLDVFVGIEMTGQSVQFEQKFNYRRPMYLVMDYLWEISEYQEVFYKLAEEAEKHMEAVIPPLFLRFINLLINDAVFLLDEALTHMSKLKEMSAARENGEWETLPAQERTQNLGYLQHTGMIARFNNILGKDTIKTLERLTSKITIVFTHPTMIDRVAAMLNYFLLNLVGPNQKKFKVKDYKEYNFDPANTVLDICKIYVNLSNTDQFCLAVSQDGRSYSPKLFQLAIDVLIKIGGGILIGDLEEVAQKIRRISEEQKVNEDATAEAPDHFLDPIMSTLMLDPVILPSSKQIVDRTTIARHLLSDQTDPFNRSPLTMDQVLSHKDLHQEIHNWLRARKAN